MLMRTISSYKKKGQEINPTLFKQRTILQEKNQVSFFSLRL